MRSTTKEFFLYLFNDRKITTMRLIASNKDKKCRNLKTIMFLSATYIRNDDLYKFFTF